MLEHATNHTQKRCPQFKKIQLNTSIIISLISLFGIFSASFITYLITKYQINRSNKHEYKLKKIDDFLQAISELCEYSSLFHHGENVAPMGRNKHSELLEQANARRYKIHIL